MLHGPWAHQEGVGGKRHEQEQWEEILSLLSRGALDAFGEERGGQGARWGDRRREQLEVRTAKRCVGADPTSGKGRRTFRRIWERAGVTGGST